VKRRKAYVRWWIDGTYTSPLLLLTSGNKSCQGESSPDVSTSGKEPHGNKARQRPELAEQTVAVGDLRVKH
jgi:hypothetical protein